MTDKQQRPKLVAETYQCAMNGGATEYGYTFKLEGGGDDSVFELALGVLHPGTGATDGAQKMREVRERWEWAAEAVVEASKRTEGGYAKHREGVRKVLERSLDEKVTLHLRNGLSLTGSVGETDDPDVVELFVYRPAGVHDHTPVHYDDVLCVTFHNDGPR